MQASGSYPAILLLATSESAANLDRRALRDAGFPNVRFHASGLAAARYLGKTDRPSGAFDPAIVICQQQLHDMEGEQFCAIIRQHPHLKHLPILLILPNDQEAAQAQAMGSSATMLLGRPYSIDTLKKRIDALLIQSDSYHKDIKANSNPDTSAFDDALATCGILLKPERQPEDYFKAGIRFLEESRWTLAIEAFEHAISDDRIRAEASLGLAAAYKGKGDLANARNCLATAAETFVAEKRWQRARTTFARLLQHDPSARNPFLTEAHRLIREKDYATAADTLAQCMSLLPKIKAGERLARICLSADDPQEMLKYLDERLKSGGSYAFLANQISQSLSQMERQREERLAQQARERKWQLAQTMKNRTSTESAASQPAQDSRARLANAIKALKEKEEIRPAADWALDPEDYVSIMEQPADVPFAKKGFFGEILSMIRLTWQLDKKSRKNS